MPTLNLFTNVPVDAVIASDILKDATKAISKTLSKPESYVMVLINGGVPIAFAGTEEAAAYGELVSIGGLGPGVNGKLSSIIADILQTKLSIDANRFYIKFYDAQSCIDPYRRVEGIFLANHSNVARILMLQGSQKLGDQGVIFLANVSTVSRTIIPRNHFSDINQDRRPFFGFNGATF